MSGIQRWTDYGDDNLDDHPEGEYVLYDDHLAEVERIKAEWREHIRDLRDGVSPPDGWFTFGSFLAYPWIDVELSERTGQDGLPLWSRPVVRMLTADDPQPAIGSVVLSADGRVAHHTADADGYSAWEIAGVDSGYYWLGLFTELVGPVRLLWDGAA